MVSDVPLSLMLDPNLAQITPSPVVVEVKPRPWLAHLSAERVRAEASLRERGEKK